MAHQPMRVDHWLRDRYPGLGRRHIEEALSHRLVTTAGGGVLSRGDNVEPGHVPSCARLDEHLAALRAGNPELEVSVITETADLIVVDKPPGMPSHPLSLMENGTVTNWALARYPEIAAWAPPYQPTISPHRLDTGTSGILLVARTSRAYEDWRIRFGARQVEKTYLAWCRGIGPHQPLVCTRRIAHDPADRRRMVCLEDGAETPNVRSFPAETHVRTLEQGSGHFLCELTMRTGVTHQLRVHMASLGFALLGDGLYGPAPEQRYIGVKHALLRCIGLKSGDVHFRAPDVGFRRDPLA